MALELLKAFVLGLIVTVPLGPVLVLVVQRSMCVSRKAGFATGLGGNLADTTYASIGLFALGAIKDFVSANQNVIMFAGGILVAVFGITMFFNDPFSKKIKVRETNGKLVSYTVQTYLCAIANPAALAIMIAMLTLFKLDVTSLHLPVWIVLPVILAGGATYWFVMSGLIARLGRKLNLKTLLWINRIAGVAVLAFGIILVIKGITKLWI